VDLEGGRDGWSSSSPRMVIPAVLWFRLNSGWFDLGSGAWGRRGRTRLLLASPTESGIKASLVGIGNIHPVDIMQNDVVLTSCIL
jgi:hypothetical protein